MRVSVLTLVGLLTLACRPGEAPSARSAESPLQSPPVAEDLDPAPDRLEVQLVAERAPDGTYLYSGQRPGPTLRAKVGDRVIVHLDNQLDVPTTLHWHGVGVPNDMDGVPWVSGVVEPGARFTYRFVVERPGTFWYHPHFDTARQVDLGLYGAFVVEAPDRPPLEERVLVLDDPDEPDRHPDHGHGALVRRWTVNQADAPQRLTSPEPARYRLRLINASNAAYLWLHADGIEVEVIAGDQGFDGGPRALPYLLGPGDRAELDVGVPGPGRLLSRGWSLNGGPVPWAAPVELVRFEVEAPGSAPEPPRWPFSGAAPSPAPGAVDVVWTLTGSDRTGWWTIDGRVFPDIEPTRLPLGAEAVIEVRNMSPTEHPFHLHGFPFEVLSRNGVPPAHRTVEDTVNLRIRERVRLSVSADRAGDWMAHCHILPHADDGMMTVLRVGP